MASHSRSLHTSAAPEVVWRIWSDPPGWATWNPDVSSVTLEGPFGVGAGGTMTTKSGGSHQIQFTTVEDGRAFELETRVVPLTQFVFRCEVWPESDGGSQISQTLTMRGPLAVIFSPMMGGRIAEAFDPILRGLAARASRWEANAGNGRRWS